MIEKSASIISTEASEEFLEYVKPLEDYDSTALIGWSCGTINLLQAAERAVFYNRPSLTDIYLPQNIEIIHKDAFFNCNAHIHYEACSLTAQAIAKSKEPKHVQAKPTRTPQANHTTPVPFHNSADF